MSISIQHIFLLLLRIRLHGNYTYTTTAEDYAKITGHKRVIGKGNVLRL